MNARRHRFIALTFGLFAGLLWLVQARLQAAELGRIPIFALSGADDFAHYYGSARRLVAGEQIYCRPFDESELQIHESTAVRTASNPPPMMILLAPLAYLNQPTAWFAWNAAMLTVFVFVLYAFSRSCRISAVSSFGIVCISVLSGPFLSNLRYSQIQPLIAALLVGVFMLYGRELRARAGVLFGVALVLKMLPIPLLFWFVGRRDWRFLAAAGGAFFFVFVFSAMLLPDPLFQFVHCALPYIQNWSQSSTFNQSAAGVIRNAAYLIVPDINRETLVTVYRAASAASVLVSFAACTILGNASRIRHRSTLLGAALFISVVGAPLAWPAYYVLLLLVVPLMLPEQRSSFFLLAMIVAMPWQPWLTGEITVQRTLLERLPIGFLTVFPALLCWMLFAASIWNRRRSEPT